MGKQGLNHLLEILLIYAIDFRRDAQLNAGLLCNLDSVIDALLRANTSEEGQVLPLRWVKSKESLRESVVNSALPIVSTRRPGLLTRFMTNMG